MEARITHARAPNLCNTEQIYSWPRTAAYAKRGRTKENKYETQNKWNVRKRSKKIVRAAIRRPEIGRCEQQETLLYTVQRGVGETDVYWRVWTLLERTGYIGTILHLLQLLLLLLLLLPLLLLLLLFLPPPPPLHLLLYLPFYSFADLSFHPRQVSSKLHYIIQASLYIQARSCTRTRVYMCVEAFCMYTYVGSRHHGRLPIWHWVPTRASPRRFFFLPFLTWLPTNPRKPCNSFQGLFGGVGISQTFHEWPRFRYAKTQTEFYYRARLTTRGGYPAVKDTPLSDTWLLILILNRVDDFWRLIFYSILFERRRDPGVGDINDFSCFWLLLRARTIVRRTIALLLHVCTCLTNVWAYLLFIYDFACFAWFKLLMTDVFSVADFE